MPSFRYHPLLLLFLLVIFETFAAAVGYRRSILRALGEGDGLPDYAVDLNSSTFDSVLKESPASFAIVEFFAHWCPACRNYKPHYEKVARLFNGPNAVHPGIILMTRVDCAMKISTFRSSRMSSMKSRRQSYRSPLRDDENLDWQRKFRENHLPLSGKEAVS